MWGPIWGFIALEEDLNTVYGAGFDHKAETPGLGAEINQLFFQEPFIGKTIFEDDEFISIRVVKGGASKADKDEIYVSSLTRQITESAGDINFEDKDEVALKGLSGVHKLSAVIWE